MIKEEWDLTPYGTRSTKEALKLIEDIRLDGYDLLKEREGHKQNFFIWKKKNKSEYLRITLIPKHRDGLFYWNLEKSFKPFAWKYNNKMTEKGINNIKSNGFKGNSSDYLTELQGMIKLLK